MTPNPGEDTALHSLAKEITPPIPDAGFTARVLDALPPPRISRPSLPQSWLVALVSALAGLGLALWRGATWESVLTAVTSLGNGLISLCTEAGDPWVLLALGLSAGSVLIAREFTRRGGMLR